MVFETITNDGIIYSFTKIEKTAVDSSLQHHGSIPIATSWYLSKITHPLGDVIEFLYGSIGYVYILKKSDDLTFDYAGDDGI